MPIEIAGEALGRELLRTDALSMGVYQLKVSATDALSPHTEVEVYYVVGGRAKFGLETRSGWQPQAQLFSSDESRNIASSRSRKT